MRNFFGSDCSNVNLKITSVNEKRVRKWWLVSLVVFLFVSMSFLFGNIFVSLFIEGNFLGTSLMLCAMCLGFGMSISIPYVFAYKKKGTLFLKFIMIVLPMQELIGLAQNAEFNLAGLTIFQFCLVFILLSAKTFYWINCWRLHQINMEYKKYKKTISF